MQTIPTEEPEELGAKYKKYNELSDYYKTVNKSDILTFDAQFFRMQIFTFCMSSVPIVGASVERASGPAGFERKWVRTMKWVFSLHEDVSIFLSKFEPVENNEW